VLILLHELGHAKMCFGGYQDRFFNPTPQKFDNEAGSFVI